MGLKWEEESELRLLLPRPLRFSQSSCAAELLQNTASLPVLQQGVTEGPPTSSGVWFCSNALLLCFSNHSSAVPVLFRAALTTELFVHHNKWFPVLQVNLFLSCLQRQLEQAPGHRAGAELAVPQQSGGQNVPGGGRAGQSLPVGLCSCSSIRRVLSLDGNGVWAGTCFPMVCCVSARAEPPCLWGWALTEGQWLSVGSPDHTCWAGCWQKTLAPVWKDLEEPPALSLSLSTGCPAARGDRGSPGLWQHLRGGQWQRGAAQ